VLASGAVTAGGSRPPTTLVFPPWTHTYGFTKFRQFHMTLHGGRDRRIDDPQGIAVARLDASNGPEAGDDDEVTVLGVNAGRGEVVYNPTVYTLAFLPQRLRGPVGVALDARGRGAVAEAGADRLVLLRMGGNGRLRADRTVAFAESGRPLAAPAGVAIAAGRLYVADAGGDRVVVADTSGRYLDTWEGFRGPFGVAAIDGPEANFYGARLIAVTDSLQQRLTLLDDEGRRVAAVRHAEVNDVDGTFAFVAFDYYANVFVTDTRSGCVYKFDRGLAFLTRFECAGDETDELDEPRGIAIHRPLGQVFIAESSGVSYYWIGTDVLHLRARGVVGPDAVAIEARFMLTEHARVTVELEGADGQPPMALVEDVLVAPGRVRRVFRPSPSSLPCRVADCKYRLTVRARPTYASRKHLEAVASAPVRWTDQLEP